jgi:hypothetical protein
LPSPIVPAFPADKAIFFSRFFLFQGASLRQAQGDCITSGFINFAGIWIDVNIIKTGWAKHFRIDMPAAVTPQVIFAAIFTKANLAAVTKNYSFLLSANQT